MTATQTTSQAATVPTPETLDFDLIPDGFAHWQLSIEGDVATLRMNVQEDGGLRDDYQLKLPRKNRFNLSISQKNCQIPKSGLCLVETRPDCCGFNHPARQLITLLVGFGYHRQSSPTYKT